jgi:colanic acid/amylovoran biosynthesis glycosyltransferase
VLVVGVKWPPEAFLRRLFDRLLSAGLELTIATAARPGREWRHRENFHWLEAPAWSGPAVVRGPRLAWTLLRAAANDADRLRRFARRAATAGDLAGSARRLYRLLPFVGKTWDVIYFPWNGAAIDYAPLYDLGIPVVVSCRGAQINIAPHNERRAALRNGLRESLARAARVHCVSNDIRREAIQLGADPDRTEVITPAVDPDMFFPAPPAGEPLPFTIVSTGSLIWRKGYEYALQAVRHLVDAGVDARYQIIGDGPDRQRVLFTIQDLGLHGRVDLLGHLEPEQLVERLQQANAFVLSSLSEGIANAVLEAMACGLPVVTTDCGGMAEVVRDEVEGLVVPVWNARALAAALGRLAADADMRRTMGNHARERVMDGFTLERQTSEFLALLEGVRRPGEQNVPPAAIRSIRHGAVPAPSSVPFHRPLD